MVLDPEIKPTFNGGGVEETWGNSVLMYSCQNYNSPEIFYWVVKKEFCFKYYPPLISPTMRFYFTVWISAFNETGTERLIKQIG